jgi:hypothetical protein
LKDKYFFDFQIQHTPFKPGDSCIWRSNTKAGEILRASFSFFELLEAIYPYGIWYVVEVTRFVTRKGGFEL